MCLHLRSSALLTVIVVILAGCKSLPPRLESMTDRFVCFHAKNTKEYRDRYTDEVTARGLDCNALAFEPVKIPPRPKETLVATVKPSQRNPVSAERFQIFGNASDDELCEKYDAFFAGKEYVDIGELRGFARYVDRAGLGCETTEAVAIAAYTKAQQSSLFSSIPDSGLCTKLDGFTEGRITMTFGQLTALQTQLNSRKPACWDGSTLVGSVNNEEPIKRNQTLTKGKGEQPKEARVFASLSNLALCTQYDKLFEGNSKLKSEERKALRFELEERSLNCSANTNEPQVTSLDDSTGTEEKHVQSVESEVLAKYGKPDQIERLGRNVVFKFCKSGWTAYTYTYVWADTNSVRQVFKGIWDAPFLCASGHRQVNWADTPRLNALTLVKPPPRKSFGEAMAEGLESARKANQDIYRDLGQSIKSRSSSFDSAPVQNNTVECTDGVGVGYGKRTRTFSGTFCPGGKSRAISTVECKKIGVGWSAPVETFSGNFCPPGYSSL